MKCPSEFGRSLHDLPTEVIVEILAHLPVKSIGRFRCVSKSWAALTSSPSFINAHLNLHSSNNNKHQILCTLPFWNPNHRHSIYLLRRGGSAAPLLLDFPPSIQFKYSPESQVRACSHRGLVCLWAYGSASPIYLWNPSTRETRALPASRHHSSHRVRFAWAGLGSLRLSDGTEDYKVVRVLRLQELEIIAEVYSLRRDSWKAVAVNPKMPLIRLCSSEVAVVNQTVNWIGLQNPLRFAMVSFDVAAETFRCIEFSPNCLLTPRIGAWKESVGVLVETESGEWEVWVMGETSWAKVFVFKPDDHMGGSVTPLGLTTGDEILLSRKRKSRIMRMKVKEGGEMGGKVVDEEFDFVLPMDVDVGCMCACYGHMESLVSIN
ncbi:F-box/kelch-repeat protein At3g23880-like [Malania oleifera]|uniref:F-box/kelch-repeat protein At3g23880-like n=1 Tax=Malania oleifera TaxID=397392 RepID=UPI0025AE94C0|nr:F-box/kelch-repeat protein At3g23880-like [Malania oleifera]